MIYCRTLGPLVVTVDDAPAPADLLWRKNIALLLYLARAPAHRCTRDHAIGLLWSDKDESAARQSLREAIRVLRRSVGEDHLRTEHDQLELAAGAIELDTERFDRHVAAADWGPAASLVVGEFAQGFAVPDASPFEDWLLAERGHWGRRAMDALVAHAEQRLAAGDLLGADEPARRALQLDPLSERALRTLLRRLALAGDRAGALELHDAFAVRVAEERATPLEAETQALADRLRRGRAWRLPQQALAAERGVEWRRGPLVARERELAQILDCWRTVRSTGAALVVIEAPAGSGKTRLTEEVMARVALDGGVAATARAVPADHDQPLAGVISLARGGLLDAPGVAAAPPAALAALGRVVGEWAERYPTPPAGPELELDLIAAMTEILRAASAEQLLLLVYDDAQWLDAPSLAALETLLRNLARAPILVVIATTGEPEPPTIAQLRARLGRDLRGVALRLAPFDDSAIHALVRWALPSYTEEEADRLSRRIAADSAGNPLLAVEICHATAQGLDLAVTSGAWPQPLRTLDQTMPGDLPDTIVAAIRVGFNCLTADARAVLCAVAVLGERVSPRRIGAATRLATTARDAALDELEWRRWLVAEPRGYSFVARIVRDVVQRDMVTPGQRQRILEATEGGGTSKRE
jgi:DNA-binding SARP family transcriptional activator